ncbi:hypothetical protein [Aliiruegeria sabulilitoris]|nr:hypothetical protein [Aliiruegeria sabulilitoris]
MTKLLRGMGGIAVWAESVRLQDISGNQRTRNPNTGLALRHASSQWSMKK